MTATLGLRSTAQDTDSILTTEQAKIYFKGVEHQIKAIRDVRTNYEKYHAQSEKRECLRKLLKESLESDEVGKKQDIKPCDLQLGSLENRIDQFSKLKPIAPFFNDLDPTDGVTEEISLTWLEIWPAVLKALTALHRACNLLCLPDHDAD